jgi:hypothetical protein
MRKVSINYSYIFQPVRHEDCCRTAQHLEQIAPTLVHLTINANIAVSVEMWLSLSLISSYRSKKVSLESCVLTEVMKIV